MSDKDNKAIEDFQKQVATDAEYDRLKNEVNLKKAKVDQKRYTQLLEQVTQDEKDLEIAKKINFGAMTPEQIAEIQSANDDYIEAARNRMEFIDPAFDKLVPFFRKNLLLIGAKTGEGKSTAAANIAESVMRQVNPVTGKKRRALILTNEEKAEDFYNRVTALTKGWHYTNHSDFTEEQIATFRKAIPLLAAGGRLTVVDNTFGGSHGMTTSIEGIEQIFENLLEKKEYYDVVIIDYYQNIIHCKTNPHMSENDVQAKLSRMLDRYKNIYPAPIVVFCQINAPDKDDKTPFQQRIKGRKMIMDPSTVAMELGADRKKKATQFTFWKSRFTQAVGKAMMMGYQNGRYVPYNIAFQEKVQKDEYERQIRDTNKQMDKANGIPDAFKKDDNGNNT